MNLDPLIEATGELFGVHVRELVGPGRARYLVYPRFAFYLVVRKRLGCSLPMIAAASGRKDHTTVLYGLQRAVKLEATDKDFAAKVDRLAVCAELLLATLVELDVPIEELQAARRRRGADSIERASACIRESLERIAVQNPAGFDRLLLEAGSYAATHHH